MIAASLEAFTRALPTGNEAVKGLSGRGNWEEAMEEMSQAAYSVYRRDIAENPDVLEYFEQATPVLELDTARIGSRPSPAYQGTATRRPAGDSLGVWLDAEPSRGPGLVWSGPRAGKLFCQGKVTSEAFGTKWRRGLHLFPNCCATWSWAWRKPILILPAFIPAW